MDKKKLFFIAGGAVLAVVALIVGLSFIGKEPPEETTGNLGAANVNTALTEAEKSSIKAATEEFVLSLGNYGWYPDLIKNPEITGNTFDERYFYEQEHTTADDSRAVLRKLTNSTAFDNTVNENAYNAPFVVESQLLEEVTVPDRPVAEGDQTLVPVTVPVRSSITYISTSTGYYDENNVLVEPEIRIQTFDFEGELELRFSKSNGSWFVSGFENTVGIFATDEFSVFNGDLMVNTKPVSSEMHPVN